ncbi:response regulator transcription factor [Paenibacillus sp. A14]|uniref:response regulator transcription factor n=1 Tax=Paenibacillus sp. A14 TaxID=3119820 RepID=UPI002FE42721
MAFKVLLVDDEPGALEGMQLWIDWEALGYEICGTGSNGREGLRLIEELEPDLVVTDVNMPLMNGLEMIEAWKARSARPMRFALMSGYSEFEYAQKAMRFGITHYLLKPVEAEEAAAELEQIRDELLREAERSRVGRVAAYEETAALVRQLLADPGGTKAVRPCPLLDRVSASRAAWNCCLVHADEDGFREAREWASSLLEDNEALYLIDLDSDQFVLVYGEDAGKATGEAKSGDVMSELIRGYAGRPVCLALGEGCKSLYEIGHSYVTAIRAMSHRFYEEGDFPQIFTHEATRSLSFNHHYDQIPLTDRIIEAIQLMKADDFEEAVTMAARSFREKRMAPDIVEKAVIHLLYKISEYLREMLGDQAEEALGPFHVPGVSAYPTLGGMMECLSSFGEACIDLLSREQARKAKGIVEEINRYILGHYREALTIKRLAEIFYLHPVYLGQLLMKKNGVSFHDMVHDLRIEEALRLLHEREMKNCDIAEQIGYANYGQFLKQFEKRHGMSPKEYKSRI